MGCTEKNITRELQILDNRIKVLANLYGRYILQARAKGLYDEARAKSLFKAAKKLGIDGWTLIWKVPMVIRSCTNTTQCVSVDVSGPAKEFLLKSEQIMKLVKKAVKRFRRAGEKRLAKRLLSEANKLHTLNTEGVAALPKTVSQCSE